MSVSNVVGTILDTVKESDDVLDFNETQFGALVWQSSIVVKDTINNVQTIVTPIDAETHFKVLLTPLNSEKLRSVVVEIQFDSNQSEAANFSGIINYYFVEGNLILKTVYQSNELVSYETVDSTGKRALSCFWECLLVQTGMSIITDGCLVFLEPCVAAPNYVTCAPITACLGVMQMVTVVSCVTQCCDELQVACPGPVSGGGIDPNGNAVYPIEFSMRSCGGSSPYLYQIVGETGWQSSDEFTIHSPGLYRIRVKDADGCKASDKVRFYP